MWNPFKNIVNRWATEIDNYKINAVERRLDGQRANKQEVYDALVKHQRCPDCNCQNFFMGPEGGACQNIECVSCHSRFNYCPGMIGERIS
jgi:hypothetical protein